MAYRYKGVTFLALAIILTFAYLHQQTEFVTKITSFRKQSVHNPLDLVFFKPEGSLEEIELVEKQLLSLNQEDPRLIKYVRYKYITPPSEEKYNLKDETSSTDHTAFIRKLFKEKRNGVFIESGANSGEYTHTFKLEQDLGWTGLLVECNPTVVPYLKSTHRKAWIAGVCLSPGVTPSRFNFSNPTSWTYSGRIGGPINLERDFNIKTNWTFFDVESVPLYTILEAIGMREIDYWSLDVEGSEIGIVKSLPFDKIKIKVIICEIHFFSQTEKDDLDLFLNEKGFMVYKKSFSSYDRVYVQKNFFN